LNFDIRPKIRLSRPPLPLIAVRITMLFTRITANIAGLALGNLMHRMTGRLADPVPSAEALIDGSVEESPVRVFWGIGSSARRTIARIPGRNPGPIGGTAKPTAARPGTACSRLATIIATVAIRARLRREKPQAERRW
jgi:hypothetical protein